MNDNQTLNAAHTQYGNPIQTYDDGYGPLFILRDSMSILGVIRARTWEDAYSIAEDGFFPEADHLPEIMRECGVEPERSDMAFPMPADPEELFNSAIFQEAYGFRPNGPNTRDTHQHGIYSRDLNGESLDQTTQAELLTRYNITLDITTEPEEPEA